MCLACEGLGLRSRSASPRGGHRRGSEIGIGAGTLVCRNQVQLLKYAVHSVARRHGKTATFMCKPPGGRQRQRHARAPVTARRAALFATLTSTAACRTWRSTTSAASSSARRRSTPSQRRHQRLQAPGRASAAVMLAYSARNRSASIRIRGYQSQARRMRCASRTRCQSVLRLHGDDARRPRRHPEQRSPGRPGRQGSLRPRAGRPNTSRRCATRSTWRSSISTRIAVPHPRRECSPAT